MAELSFLTKADLPDNAFTVSRSRINTWSACQWRHHLTYNRDLERQNFSNPAMKLGTAIHKHWDLFYQQFLGTSVGYLDDNEIQEICYPIYSNPEEYANQIFNLRAASLLNRYKDYAATNDMFIPVATEYELFADMEMVTPDGRAIFLHGIIDLIFEIDGVMGFLDHKSGGKFWDDRNAYFDNQLAFYYLLFHLNGLPFEVAFINNVNTYPYKDLAKQADAKLFKRIPVYKRKMQIDHYLNNLRQTIRQILNLTKPVKNLDQHCAWCPFHDVCDIELRGLDPERMITQIRRPEVNFNTDILVEDTYYVP